MSERKLVSKKDLKLVYGIPYSPQHILRLENEGKFPRRLRLGNGPRSRCAWKVIEVEAWIDARLASRESSS